jgi:hypothetical protein
MKGATASSAVSTAAATMPPVSRHLLQPSSPAPPPPPLPQLSLVDAAMTHHLDTVDAMDAFADPKDGTTDNNEEVNHLIASDGIVLSSADFDDLPHTTATSSSSVVASNRIKQMNDNLWINDDNDNNAARHQQRQREQQTLDISPEAETIMGSSDEAVYQRTRLRAKYGIACSLILFIVCLSLILSRPKCAG